jgi:hypothetical protein
MKPLEPPPRLVDALGPAGDCVRRALNERPSRPLPGFDALRERRSRRTAARWTLAFAAVVLAVPAAVWFSSGRVQPPLRVSAEPVVPLARALATPSASARDEKESPPVPSSPQALPKLRPSSRPRLGPAPHGEPESQAPLASARVMPSVLPNVTPAVPTAGAKPCVELARAGAAEDAIGCYERLARGTGVTAELALFEQARLAGKVLRQPARALAALEDYRRRFPSGSLRAEVMLARIDWLLGAGDREGALGAVDEALASGLLKERRAELTRLRASLGAPNVAQ